MQHESQVGFDLLAQHQFERLTAGLLTSDELVAVENSGSEYHTADISPARALEITESFILNSDATDLLPSLVQHHAFNKKVINEARERTQELLAQNDELATQLD